MWTFLFAGLLYLVGVAIVLVVKPSFMFTPDGNWKEFGIGKTSERYTPFPFWLFCLVWAVVAYVIILIIVRLYPSTVQDDFEIKKPNNRTNNHTSNRRAAVNQVPIESAFDEDGSVELPKGYYVLNKKATKLSGMPKYVYLGPEEPVET